ncbi:MAG: DNA repair protein RecO [Phycisphaerae bacterium]
MALVRDTAIVLRRLDFSETSQILAMLTREHGQQHLIAKGIKRSTKTRVAVGIDLLELGSLVYSRRTGREGTLATLTEWRQEDHFPHLRRSLVGLYAGLYAAEATTRLTEVHDPHPELFDGLVRLFRALREEGALATLGSFLWLLLKEVGLRPDLVRCVSCDRRLGQEPLLYFSSRSGGAICRDCEPAIVDKRRIDPATAAVLSEAAAESAGPLPALAAEPAFDLMDYHIRETLSQPLRVSSSLREVLRQRRRAP